MKKNWILEFRIEGISRRWADAVLAAAVAIIAAAGGVVVGAIHEAEDESPTQPE